MAREKVPVKELYTEEELLTIRIPKSVRREAVGNSLMSAMFGRLGKTFEWAKEHDKKELPITFLFAFTEKEFRDFKDFVTKVIKKQLYPYSSKKMLEHSAGMFLFLYGVVSYNGEDGYNKFKENVRHDIARYEQKNGELTYSDGWEKELKEWCGYKPQGEEAQEK